MLSTDHLEHRLEDGSHWLYMHRDPSVRPCFHRGLLDSVALLKSPHALSVSEDEPLAHLVVASLAPVFNLGGDLDFFGRMIRTRNRDELLDYGMLCVDGIHALHHHLHGRARTIALVQGDALGGGMELALACQLIVMERGATMGLPEVLFGLFPGMGAYSFLKQRVSPQMAESIILSGRTYGADELLDLGVVDRVAEPGRGATLVRELIRQERRAPHAHLALGQVRRMTSHVSHEELAAVVSLWVDTAMKLPDRSLRMMERLVRAQTRSLVAPSAPRRPGL